MTADLELEPEPEPGPALVAESEAELIRVLRALITGDAQGVTGRMFRLAALPPAISTAAERVLGDALAQVWPALWRRSGALPIALAEGEATRRGRIWALRPPVGLTFSTVTLQLLRWLVTAPPLPEQRPVGRRRRLREVEEVGVDHLARRAAGPPPSVGDQVIGYLTLEATEGTPLQARVAAHRPVRELALAWLGFPDVMSAPGPADDAEAHAIALAGLDALATGAGAVVAESLAGDLGRRWRAIELAKRQATQPGELIALGAAQDAVLDRFMAACDRAGRRELAGFVLDAAAPLLERGLSPLPAELDRATSLAIRAQARVAAGALLRGVVRWAGWDEAHRGVRFMDDDYAASQLLLARFERVGAAGTAQAATWLSQLAALPT